MKLIDRAIDYVTNRVLDRVEERRKPASVTNITVYNRRGAGDDIGDDIAQEQGA